MEGLPTEEDINQIQHFSKECEEFESTIKEQFITLDSGQYQRMIFGGDTELRDQEEEKLEEFREYCKSKGITIPEGYDDESRFVLRVLQGKKWNLEVTANEIITHSEWKKATYPLKYDPVKEILT